MDERLAEWEVVRDYAELALTTGDAARALVMTGELLETPGVQEATELQWSVRRIRAHALEATGDREGAIEELERLVTETPRDVEWIRLMIALTRCYRESGDLNASIEVVRRAEGVIAELGPAAVEDAIRLRLTVTDAYFRRGDMAYAVHLCRREVEAAERAGSRVGLASAYWNASVFESARGNSVQALPMAVQALAVLEAGEDARNAARLRLAVGAIELRLPGIAPDVPLATLQRAERELELTSASTVDRGRDHLDQCQALYRLGDLDAAERQLERAEVLLPPHSDVISCEMAIWRGRIAAARGGSDAARTHYREADEQVRQIDAGRDRAVLWHLLAGSLEHLGDSEEAMAAYRSAAESTGLGARVAPPVEPVARPEEARDEPYRRETR
jgi:tetratricopeptide (TPR) repeat protein